MRTATSLSTRMGLWLAAFILLATLLSGGGYFYFFNKLDANHQTVTLLNSGADMTNSLNSILLEKIRAINTLVSSQSLKNALANSNAEYGKLRTSRREERIIDENDRWRSTTSSKEPTVALRLNSSSAKILKLHTKENPGIYGEIFITNKYGVTVGTTGKLSTLSHANKYWWKASFADGRGRIFIDDRGYDDSVGSVVLGLVLPVLVDGELIGIIKANLNMAPLLSNFVDINSENRDYQFSIYRSTGLALLYKKSKPLTFQAPDDIAAIISQTKPNFSIIQHYLKTHLHVAIPIPLTLGTSKISFGGKSNTSGHRLGNGGEHWSIVLSKDQDILDLSNPEILSFALFFIIILLLVPILGVLLIRNFLAPINELTAEIEDFDIEKGFKVKQFPSSREHLVLATAFGNLSERLGATLVSRDELAKEIEQRGKAELILDSFLINLYTST